MFQTKTILCSIIVIIFLFSENAISQAGKGSPLLTKYASKPRAGNIVARSFAGGRMSGGVLTAGYTDVWLGEDQNLVDPSKIGFGDYDYNTNELCLHVDKSTTCYQWKITTDRLSRLASFVENDGIGLFSAYGEFIEKKSEDEREGYVRCESTPNTWCASEIVGSSLEKSFYDVDLNSHELWNPEPRKSELIAELNSGLPNDCLLYTSPSPRDATLSRMPSSA